VNALLSYPLAKHVLRRRYNILAKANENEDMDGRSLFFSI
jgi:hypothetical protein